MNTLRFRTISGLVVALAMLSGAALASATKNRDGRAAGPRGVTVAGRYGAGSGARGRCSVRAGRRRGRNARR